MGIAIILFLNEANAAHQTRNHITPAIESYRVCSSFDLRLTVEVQHIKL